MFSTFYFLYNFTIFQEITNCIVKIFRMTTTFDKLINKRQIEIFKTKEAITTHINPIYKTKRMKIFKKKKKKEKKRIRLT